MADAPGRNYPNSILEEIYEKGICRDTAGNEYDCFPASLPFEDGLELLRIVRDRELHETLEIGMAWGVSTVFICEGNRGRAAAKHMAIDPFQEIWFKKAALHTVDRAGTGVPVTLICEPSFLALPKLIAQGKQYDFIFIDGNHRFEHTFVDIFLAERLLRVGGTVALHDIWLPSVRKVVAFVRQNRAEVLEAESTQVATAGPGPAASGLRWFNALRLKGPAPLDARIDSPYSNIFCFRKISESREDDLALAWDKFDDF